MGKLIRFLGILVLLGMLLLPTVTLADTADWSVVDGDLVWGDGINGNFAHNTWYSDGRHWVMYYEYDIATSGIKIASTANYGATWSISAPLDGTTDTLFNGFACWYHEDTDLLHYARVDIGNETNYEIYYRAGTPTAAGAITWVAAEALIEEGVGVGGVTLTVTIACDENGLPFVAWTEDEDDTGYFWTEVASSEAANGTWVESMDTWEEFDQTGAALYGHDYDELSSGNWTAIAVNLCPVNNEGDLMQLAWTWWDVTNDYVGIDTTIWNEDDTAWGNLSWAVVPDAEGLYPSVMGGTAFSCYDLGAAIHLVFMDINGDLYYNGKSQIESWDDVNGSGNWTLLDDNVTTAFPAIAGYDDAELGEDLIVVYHNATTMYYTLLPFGGGWTTPEVIWSLLEYYSPNGDAVFLHSLQYKYTGGSPVGFAWEAGGLAWDEAPPPGLTGDLFYWFIDADGEDAGEDPLGYYYSAPAAPGGIAGDNPGVAILKALLPLVIAMAMVYAGFRTGNEKIMGLSVVLGVIEMVIAYTVFAIL